jgi:hypothetical protein
MPAAIDVKSGAFSSFPYEKLTWFLQPSEENWFSHRVFDKLPVKEEATLSMKCRAM